MAAADDDLSLLREVWGATHEITFDGEMYRARERGTGSADGSPTAAGLAELLVDRRLAPPFSRWPPSDLREYLASVPLALPPGYQHPSILRSGQITAEAGESATDLR